MSARRGRGLAAAVVAAALTVVGAGIATKKAPPKKWVTSMCTTVGVWLDEARTGAAAVETQSTDPANELPTAARTLQTYFHGAVDSTNQAIKRLKKAGYPDTPKGKKVAATLIDGFVAARSSLREGEHTAAKLPTNDAEGFRTAATELDQPITDAFTAVGDAFRAEAKFDPGLKIDKLVKKDPACAPLHS